MKGAKQVIMLRAALVSLGGNIFLFVAKSTALIFVHSLAIAADLGITVVGLAISIIFYHFVKVANRPADFIHNYGYGKIEHVCEALEGAALIGIAMGMSIQAIRHLVHAPEINLPWLGFGFSMVSVAVNFIGSAWILSLAKASASPAVHAEGIHYRLEGFISLTVAAAFLLAILLTPTPFKPWVVYLDPVATLLVSGLITIPSCQLILRALRKLLDSSLEEENKMEVMKLLGKYLEQCCEFRGIRSRSSGRKKFVECTLVLPRAMSFPEAHKISARIEKDLRLSIPGCEATVQIMPCDESCVFHPPREQCPYLK